MSKKRNPFREGLEKRRRQAAAQSEPVEPVQKDPSEMTDEELDREIQKTEAQLRRAKEREVVAGREELREQSRPKFALPIRRRRPYWK